MKSIFLVFAIAILPCLLTAQTITLVNQVTTSSFRGLSVVDNEVAWVSGSKGTVGITIDGGNTWNWTVVKGYEKADFRDIEAFSAKEAVIISSGTPALILKTIDGGQKWKLVYKNTDKAYFLDALEFEDSNHGLVLGDPINGKFLILETLNGGENWAPAKAQPEALPREAAFAASGTCLRFVKNNFYLVSGGGAARLINITDEKNTSNAITSLPILHNKDSQGAFSVAFNKNRYVVVGGDYSNDLKADSVAVYGNTDNPRVSRQPPAGFQSCVEYLKGNNFLSTGTSGSNLSADKGKTWQKIDGKSFNVCRRAKKGNLVIFAGDRGKIGIFKL